MNYPKKLNFNVALQHNYGHHRSGWFYALNSLKPLHVETGVLVNGFIESKFCWGYNEGDANKNPKPYNQPWIGFIHVPHRVPDWFQKEQAPQNIFKTQLWQKSFKFCQGIFCLSNYQKQWLEKRLNVLVCNLIHPTEIPDTKFDFDRFFNNPYRRIVQVGWWLRKLHSIYYLNTYINRKTVLLKKEPYVNNMFNREKELFRLNYSINSVDVLNYLSNIEYDNLLSENIVYLDLYDAGANNVIIECIARNTPILVNPLPAVREYLGEDYPFYFQNREEAAKKADDMALIKATHDYLKEHPIKEKLTADYFLNSVLNSKIYQSL